MKIFIAIFTAIAVFGLNRIQAQDLNSIMDSNNQLYRHDFVARGKSANEMQLGNYVIVGSALKEQDAKLTITQLLKLKYPEPSYGYLTKKSIWYIYYGVYKDIEQALQRRNELQKFKLYVNARLLTVHE